MHSLSARSVALILVLVTLMTSLAIPADAAAKTYTGTISKDRIFFRTRPTTSSGYITRFSKGDKVKVSAISGDFYKVTFNGKTGYVMCKYVKLASSAVKALKDAAKKTVSASAAKTAYTTRNLKWFNTGRRLFKRNSTFTIKDVKTGKTWQCKVMYGTNHLDAEPLTKADTRIMKVAYGGRITYKRRAVLVLYKNKVYAASMYGVPHGDQTITDNGFNGQFCIHFTGSKTHGSDKVDEDHQEMIQKALKATW